MDQKLEPMEVTPSINRDMCCRILP